jgi:hypothetical protein
MPEHPFLKLLRRLFVQGFQRFPRKLLHRWKPFAFSRS